MKKRVVLGLSGGVDSAVDHLKKLKKQIDATKEKEPNGSPKDCIYLDWLNEINAFERKEKIF